jgi:hypothetical protein
MGRESLHERAQRGPLSGSNRPTDKLEQSVISGTGAGLVVRTSLSTAFGSLARALTGRRVETEFDRGVSRVGCRRDRAFHALSWPDLFRIRLCHVLLDVVLLRGEDA